MRPRPSSAPGLASARSRTPRRRRPAGPRGLTRPSYSSYTSTSLSPLTRTAAPRPSTLTGQVAAPLPHASAPFLMSLWPGLCGAAGHVTPQVTSPTTPAPPAPAASSSSAPAAANITASTVLRTLEQCLRDSNQLSTYVNSDCATRMASMKRINWDLVYSQLPDTIHHFEHCQVDYSATTKSWQQART